MDFLLHSSRFHWFPSCCRFLVARVTLNGDADWLTLEAILANKSLEVTMVTHVMGADRDLL